MSEQKWIPFDLDVNFFFGTVETSDKWHKLVARYLRNTNGTINDIVKTKQIERKEGLRPGFSFKGIGLTLAEWAKENDIDLRVV